MVLLIQDILPTQDGYRISRKSRQNMVDYVAGGGLFDEESIKSHPCTRNFLIAITRFEDQALYLRDGLHRTTAIYLARPEKVLYESEFKFEDHTYDMWVNAAPEFGWFTPFDPRIEVRLPNFLGFRDEAEEIFNNDGDVIKFIANNRDRYVIPRTDIHSFEPLSKFWIARSEILE